jgi:hypothetical protein
MFNKESEMNSIMEKHAKKISFAHYFEEKKA